MKPITYWLQNEAIDQLVDHYGAHLEQLSHFTRRDLIVCLAENIHYFPGQNEDIDTVWALLEPLTRREQDLLMEAIAATLTHQPKKTGIPSPRDAHADIG